MGELARLVFSLVEGRMPARDYNLLATLQRRSVTVEFDE